MFMSHEIQIYVSIDISYVDKGQSQIHLNSGKVLTNIIQFSSNPKILNENFNACGNSCQEMSGYCQLFCSFSIRVLTFKKV